MVWCEDSPDLFAAMEKGKMYIFRYSTSLTQSSAPNQMTSVFMHAS